MPSTGLRDLTGSLAIDDVSSGSVYIIRVGPVVSLFFSQFVVASGTGEWTRIFTLPVGFRPPVEARENLLDSFSGQQLTVYASGTLYVNKHSGYSYRNTVTYATLDAWPTAAPGVAA